MRHALIALTFAALPFVPSAALAEAMTLTLSPSSLSANVQAATDADPGTPLASARAAAIRRADEVLSTPPETVTAKGLTPPSGDKKDYMSFGPYWWPNPDTADGLPYIRKDGERNPSSSNDDTDSQRLQRMGNRVLDLTLAYRLTSDDRYADAAVQQITTWFLDGATAMNPNLRFGQAIPGVTEGRGIGLIDTRNLWKVIDSAIILHDSGKLDDAQLADLKRWFGDFLMWMDTSPQGHEEYVWHNNHGTYYDAQVINFALFTGDKDRARRQLQDAVHLRMANQIAKGGKQWAELERTRPFHYSVFNLIAHLQLAHYGELVDFDYANADQDGRSLKQGVDFILGQALKPDPALFPETAKESPFSPDMAQMTLQAGEVYGPGSVPADVLDAVKTTDPEDRALLLWYAE